MSPAAVSRQYPLEPIVLQAFHRPRLLAPGIPADSRGSVKRIDTIGPPQVIAGKQIPVAIEQDRVPARMARSWNRDQIFGQRCNLCARQHPLDTGEGSSDIVVMHDSIGAEMTGPFLVIGYIVAMCKEHQAHTAKLLDALHQRGREAR